MYKNHSSPFWRTVALLIVALLPLVALGWMLIKSAEDSLIAEKVRTEEQAESLLTLIAEKKEAEIQQGNNAFKALSQKKEWYKLLRNEPRIGGIRWSTVLGDRPPVTPIVGTPSPSSARKDSEHNDAELGLGVPCWAFLCTPAVPVALEHGYHNRAGKLKGLSLWIHSNSSLPLYS